MSFYPILDVEIILTMPDGSKVEYNLEAPNGADPYQFGFRKVPILDNYPDGNRRIRRGHFIYEFIANYSYESHEMDLRKLLVARQIQLRFPPEFSDDPQSNYQSTTVFLANPQVVKNFLGGLALASESGSIVPSGEVRLNFIGTKPESDNSIFNFNWLQGFGRTLAPDPKGLFVFSANSNTVNVWDYFEDEIQTHNIGGLTGFLCSNVEWVADTDGIHIVYSSTDPLIGRILYNKTEKDFDELFQVPGVGNSQNIIQGAAIFFVIVNNQQAPGESFVVASGGLTVSRYASEADPTTESSFEPGDLLQFARSTQFLFKGFDEKHDLGGTLHSYVGVDNGGYMFNLFKPSGSTSIYFQSVVPGIGGSENYAGILYPYQFNGTLQLTSRHDLSVSGCNSGGAIACVRTSGVVTKYDREMNQIWALGIDISPSAICIDYFDNFFMVDSARILQKYSAGTDTTKPELIWEYTYTDQPTGGPQTICYDGKDTLITAGSQGRFFVHDAYTGEVINTGSRLFPVPNVIMSSNVHPGNLAQFRPPGPATKLVFHTEPSGALKNATLGTIRVVVKDNRDFPMFNDHSEITLTLTTPVGATLSGTTQKNAFYGVATFDDLTVDETGFYTLNASAENLNAVVSIEFEVGEFYSMVLNGSDQYLNLTTLGTFGSQLHNHTREYWFKGSDKSSIQYLMGNANDPASANSVFLGDRFNSGTGGAYESGDISTFLRNDVGTTRIRATNGDSGFLDGEWHKVAFVWEEGNARTYVDGNLISMQTGGNGDPADSYTDFDYFLPLGIRNNRGSLSSYYNGKVAFPAFFTRAKTDEECTENWQEIPDVDDVSLVATWFFSEGSGNSSEDKSGNGFDATLVNNVSDNMWDSDIPPITL